MCVRVFKSYTLIYLDKITDMLHAVAGAVAYLLAAYWLARRTAEDPADRLRYVMFYHAHLYAMAVGLIMAFEFWLYRSDASLDPLGALVIGGIEYAALWGGMLAFPLAFVALMVGNVMEESGAKVELPMLRRLLQREEARQEAAAEDRIIRIDNRRKRPKYVEV